MIYFDNAATTMVKPQSVIDAVTIALSSAGNAGRSNTGEKFSTNDMVLDTRKKLAKLIHAESEKQIVFTMNSTESLNIAIKGLFHPGDHIITTVLEHNSVLRPLYELENSGVELSFVNCDAQGNLKTEEISSYIKENTKAIVCTNASNLTGNYVDVKKVGEIAKEHHLLFVVDASQTIQLTSRREEYWSKMVLAADDCRHSDLKASNTFDKLNAIWYHVNKYRQHIGNKKSDSPKDMDN